MAAASNSFEGGAAGATITAANSGGASGDAFDTVTGTQLGYDIAQKAHGLLAAKVVTAAASSSVEWNAKIGTVTEIWGRAYLFLTANPSAAWQFFRAHNAGALAARLAVTATGKLTVGNAGGTTIWTSTNSVPLNGWCRVEFHMIFSSGVGQVEVSLYSGDSTTATESFLPAANLNTNTAATQFLFGNPAGGGAGTFWLDDLVVNTTGWPGPAIATRLLSGSLSASGVKVSALSGRMLAGTSTPGGVKLSRLSRPVAGAVPASGALVGSRSYFRAISGALTAAGGITRTARRSLAGSLSATGALARSFAKGTAGSVSASGIIARLPRLLPGGVTGAAGAIGRAFAKRPAGTLASTGSILGLARRLRTVAGNLTATGAVARQIGKRPAGAVSVSGIIPPRALRLRPAGAIGAASTLLRTVLRRVFGRAGTATLTVAPTAEAILTTYHRPSEVVVGTQVAVGCDFRAGGVLVDPDVVRAFVLAPNGVLSAFLYPAPELSRDAAGMYRCEFTADVAGSWGVRFEGSGTVEAVGESSVSVLPSYVM